MTHFRSDWLRDRRTKMSGELRAGHSTMSRANGAPDRTFIHHRAAAPAPGGPGLDRHPRASSSSSTTSALRKRSSRSSRSISSTCGRNGAKLKLPELLSIKRELTVIKVQIDSLLDCVDKMERQQRDRSECPRSSEPSQSPSPGGGSVSSLDRESPGPGEAGEDEQLHHQRYCSYDPHSYTHRVKRHRSEEEDKL